MVFAGFGTKQQHDLARKAINDELDVEAELKKWIQQHESSDLLAEFMDIAVAQQLPEPYHSLRQRRSDDWQYLLSEALFLLVDDNTETLSKIVERLRENQGTNELAELFMQYHQEGV
jgi:hypothetical protein